MNTGQTGAVWISELDDLESQGDSDHPGPDVVYALALFSADHQLPTGDVIQGPQNVPIDRALRWGRRRAEVVIVKVYDDIGWYSAGPRQPDMDVRNDQLPRTPLPEWSQTVVRRPRPDLAYLHRRIDDTPISWSVAITTYVLFDAPSVHEGTALALTTQSLLGRTGTEPKVQGWPPRIRLDVVEATHARAIQASQELAAQALRQVSARRNVGCPIIGSIEAYPSGSAVAAVNLGEN